MMELAEAEVLRRAAERAHHESGDRLMDAIGGWVGAKLADFFEADPFFGAFGVPASIDVRGEYADSGKLCLRVVNVLDVDGRLMAGNADGRRDLPGWFDLLDEIDPYLDWIALIGDDQWLGEHEIRFIEAPRPVGFVRHDADDADGAVLFRPAGRPSTDPPPPWRPVYLRSET